MKLEKIITLANSDVYLQFTAMERSLRATGCNLQVLVIPYDEKTFELPKNAVWFEDYPLFLWLKNIKLKGVYRKYLCLLQQNYLFVDSDIIFLRNPEDVLRGVDGFITSCGHWKNITHTTTKASEEILKKGTTNWQRNVFNSGQFACSECLFTFESLQQVCMDTAYSFTCINPTFHEQPGVNLLITLSGVKVTNLTLPPISMESTWAGDYSNEDFEQYWKEKESKPLLIHWAGRKPDRSLPIDKLYFDFLSDEEIQRWEPLKNSKGGKLLRVIDKLKRLREGLSGNLIKRGHFL